MFLLGITAPLSALHTYSDQWMRYRRVPDKMMEMQACLEALLLAENVGGGRIQLRVQHPRLTKLALESLRTAFGFPVVVPTRRRRASHEAARQHPRRGARPPRVLGGGGRPEAVSQLRATRRRYRTSSLTYGPGRTNTGTSRQSGYKSGWSGRKRSYVRRARAAVTVTGSSTPRTVYMSGIRRSVGAVRRGTSSARSRASSCTRNIAPE